MNTIRIRRRIDSVTLHLPELKPFVGRTVEIIVLAEETRSVIQPGTGDWDAAMEAVEELEDYDFEAVKRQREYDLKHADDHLT